MDREDDIRVIAYHIWEDEGCCDGRDFDHWLIAETIWEQMQEKGKGTSKAKRREKVEVANVNPASASPSPKSRTATIEKRGAARGKKK